MSLMKPYEEGEEAALLGIPATTSTHKTYTPDEVADILRVDAATIRRWAKLRLIKVIMLPQTRDGGRTVLRISHEVLENLLIDQFLPE